MNPIGFKNTLVENSSINLYSKLNPLSHEPRSSFARDLKNGFGRNLATHSTKDVWAEIRQLKSKPLGFVDSESKAEDDSENPKS